MIDENTFAETLAFVERRGCKRIGICWFERPEIRLEFLLARREFTFVLLDASNTPDPLFEGVAVFNIWQAASADMVDAVLIVEGAHLAWLMRCLEPLARRNVLILPCSADWVVPPFFKTLTPASARATDLGVAPDYTWRSALTGHYAEFGTFWGQSFFPDVFRYRNLLQGRFYAFDSFEGLSVPLADETRFHLDFQTGHYCSNERSFLALAEFVSAPADLIQVVPGFFESTLENKDPASYGLSPESLSVCKIDCDLYEPTRQVLDFVLPLLEPGALVYFDDWRLTRASPHLGERGAALDWLKRNGDIELVELHRDGWQHQWFIFHRL